ncbi:hypothetical protein GO499_19475 [Algicella marina]|uniref:Uncharacterized protein n=1 Tax=Algicella marina TaxID=2683284 RepID=A0A6P1T6R6_9RHOB|nr:hypothetical protein GO499_19475 [Algicella marina]
MTPERVAGMFTQSDGAFRFARWARPLAPVIFGTDDASLGPLKDGLRVVASLADLSLVEADPEFGSNFMMFFCRDWAELRDVPDMGRMLPDFDGLIGRLEAAGANQYRHFAHEPDGAIRFCVCLLRMDAALAAMPAEDLAQLQAARSLLLWSDTAFRDRSPLAQVPAGTIVAPDVAALIRAGYDRALPDASDDPALAYRLAARAGLLLGDLA